MDADRKLHALLRAIQEVARTESCAEACAAALAAAAAALDVPRAWIQWGDIDGAPRIAHSGLVPPACLEAAGRGLPWPGGQCAPSPPEIMVMDAAAGAPGALPEALRADGMCAATFVPMVAGGRLLGALVLLSESPRAWTADERCVAEGVAQLAADALTRARTRAARERLEHALLQARRLESVGHVAGGAAHDFNNMLTAMIGYMDLVSACLPAGTEEQGYLAQALDAAEQATELTRQMLEFARRQPAPRTPQNLNALLERIAPLVRRLMPEGVSLVVRSQAAPAWVLADAGQLEQVVVTLALRARDAMPGGGVLTLSTIRAAGTGGAPECVALEAVDTGEGLDAEALRRALEAESLGGDDGRLQLAIAASLVRASGGRMEAGRDAAGATRVRALWTLTVSPGARAESGGEVVGGGETVLFVAHDSSMRDLVAAMLSPLGYRVLTAGGADEGLVLLGDCPGAVQLLIADLVLPGMGGRELALRARETRPGLRVLLTSDYAAVPGATEVVGGMPFLPRPFTREALAYRVREALDAPPPGAGGASG